jgi:hypothetical protein
MTLDDTQTAKSTKPDAKPIPSFQETQAADWHSAKAALHSAQAAMEQAHKAFDLAVIEARTAIGKLDEPWQVRGVARPMKEGQPGPPPLPVGNLPCRGAIGGRMAPSAVIAGRIFLGHVCLDPFYVAQERFCGEERRVIAYPTARSESEALALAEEECQAAAEAWAEAVAAIVERCGAEVALEALNDAAKAEVYALQQMTYLGVPQ